MAEFGEKIIDLEMVRNLKRVVLGNTRKPWKNQKVTIKRFYNDEWIICQQVDASDINHLQPFKSYPCDGMTRKVRIECPVECHIPEIRIIIGADWQTYKNERPIRVVGTPGALTHMEVKGTSCKCHSGGEFIPDDEARLFTLPTGDTVPTWDKSLFYRRNEKNPFVCNTESLSDYRLDGDSCSCNSSKVALREMRPFTIKNSHTRTFDGTTSAGKTYDEKLQDCARSCRYKTNIDSTQPDANKQWIQDHTMNAMQMAENGRCYCYNIDIVEFSETDQSTLDVYRAFQIVPGCACDGKFMQGGHALNCPVGSYNMDSCRSKCTMCPMGYFQESTGASHCRICPKGYFQDKIGQSTCRVCLNTCPDVGDKGVGVIYECLEGSIRDDSACYRCDQDVSYATQPEDTYISLEYGSFGVKEVTYPRPTPCTKCTDGKYIDNTGCGICPAGWKSTDPVTSSCEKCAAGYYQGSSGKSSCKLCSTGKYQTEEGKLLCINCPEGFAREAYHPNSMSIMHTQAIGKGCLPCGSVYGKKWSALSASIPAANYESATPPAPGCIFCNQYQDEAGQHTCKACDQTKISGSNGKWLPYSYKDSNGKEDTVGACKYVENIYYYHERQRETEPEEELDFCNSDIVYSSDAKKKQLTEWKTCIYQKGSSTYTRGTSDFKIMTFTSWLTGLSIFSPAYKIQGYRKPEKCSPATIDYYIKDKGESCPSSGVLKGFLQQQYKSYRTSAYVFKVEEEEEEEEEEEGLSDYDIATIAVSVACPVCGAAMWLFRI